MVVQNFASDQRYFTKEETLARLAAIQGDDFGDLYCTLIDKK
jgi:hypothetical protein